MNCKNCKQELIEHSDYCNRCGGRVIRNRLTFRNLFEHISETFFNYDNKLLRTLIDLFKKPEVVIGGYINGIRKRYVNPISYFGLALTLSGLYLIIMTKFFPEALDFSIYTVEGQEEFQKRNMGFVQEYQSLIMMFYVPIYALMGLVTFIGLKKYNFTELIVIFTYIQAQISIISAFVVIIAAMIGINQGILSLFFIPLMILYSAYCLKRLYQLNFGQMVLRTFIFLVILGIVFAILSVFMAIFMYLNGDLQQMIEAQNAAKG